MIVSLWNLTGISAALLPRCLSNFRAIGKVEISISRLRDFKRSCGKSFVPPIWSLLISKTPHSKISQILGAGRLGWNDLITLKFGKPFARNTTEAPLKFQSDHTILNTSHGFDTSCEDKTSCYLVNRGQDVNYGLTFFLPRDTFITTWRICESVMFCSEMVDTFTILKRPFRMNIFVKFECVCEKNCPCNRCMQNA